MPTTEERLAALEKQMAAWMDQRPTTYYEHQYSGDEIDAAVGRALTGGALDTSVTNVSNQLGTFVRPNLLDNWYLGRLVDQREGKIIPAGKSYYTTPDITLPEVGKTDKAYTVIEIKNYSGYGQRATISISGTVYYVWDQDAVRGYMGGYTVDRWLLSVGNTLTVSSGGITISTSSDTKFQNMLQQRFPNESFSLVGKKVTLSALFSEVQGSVGVRVGGTSGNNKISSPGLVSETFIFPTEGSPYFSVETSVDSKNTFSGTLLAVKLELGHTQTLAHREGDKWVLNEVPEYGEQLRRCQRYFWRFSPAEYVAGATAFGIDANTARAMIYLPEQMRTPPALNLNASEGFFLTGASGDIFNTTISTVWTAPNSVCVDFKKSGAFEVNAPYFVRGGASAYIDISADL